MTGIGIWCMSSGLNCHEAVLIILNKGLNEKGTKEMRNAKNELLRFVAGVVLLVVGLFIFSQKVSVGTGFFGYGGFYLGGFHMTTGMVMIPFIIGVVWMFATGSFASKIFTAFSVLLILTAIIMNTHMYLARISLYEWILMLVLIFGGAGLLASVMFAGSADKLRDKKEKKNSSSKKADAVQDSLDSIDDQIEQMKKSM